MVSLLDSGAEGPGSNRSRDAIGSVLFCSVLLFSRPRSVGWPHHFRQTVHTHCASVHQTPKLVAVLLRVAGVTAGLVENNGSLPPGI